MLVRFTDAKDKIVWVNPVHVKFLSLKNPEVTTIGLNASGSAYFRIRMPIDEVAARLNAAMPLDPYAGVTDDDGEDDYGSDGAAGAAGVVAIT